MATHFYACTNCYTKIPTGTSDLHINENIEVIRKRDSFCCYLLLHIYKNDNGDVKQKNIKMVQYIRWIMCPSDIKNRNFDDICWNLHKHLSLENLE